MTNFVVVGTGVASAPAILEALRDKVTEGDVVSAEWCGTPIPESVETVYGYLVDNGIEFRLFYREDQRVPQSLRDSETCYPTKSRHPLDTMLKECDEVLFLWDEDENEKATPGLIYYVADNIREDVVIRELSNGLAPIVIATEIPDAEPAVAEVEEKEEEDEDDTRFTREELDIMTVAAVKRYGQRVGCQAKTKSGIIEELFGSEPSEPSEPDDDTPTVAGSVEPTYPEWQSSTNDGEEMVILIRNFFSQSKDNADYHMAKALLEVTRVAMLKALSAKG